MGAVGISLIHQKLTEKVKDYILEVIFLIVRWRSFATAVPSDNDRFDTQVKWWIHITARRFKYFEKVKIILVTASNDNPTVRCCSKDSVEFRAWLGRDVDSSLAKVLA